MHTQKGNIKISLTITVSGMISHCSLMKNFLGEFYLTINHVRTNLTNNKIDNSNNYSLCGSALEVLYLFEENPLISKSVSIVGGLAKADWSLTTRN